MKNFVIFALNLNDLNKEEFLVHSLFDRNNFGNIINICNGVYKGVSEQSYMVPYETKNDIRFVELLAQKFHQESILVYANGECYLSYIETGHKTPIGKWTEVSKEEAEKYDAYTEINGVYYVCKK